jgi:hypothetical protein
MLTVGSIFPVTEAMQTSANPLLLVVVDTTVTETGYYALFQQALFSKLLYSWLSLNHHSFMATFCSHGGLAWSCGLRQLKVSFGKGFRSPAIREHFCGS